MENFINLKAMSIDVNKLKTKVCSKVISELPTDVSRVTAVEYIIQAVLDFIKCESLGIQEICREDKQELKNFYEDLIREQQ